MIVVYAETGCLLDPWCELRQNFLHFRVDRIIYFEVLDENKRLVRPITASLGTMA